MTPSNSDKEISKSLINQKGFLPIVLGCGGGVIVGLILFVIFVALGSSKDPDYANFKNSRAADGTISQGVIKRKSGGIWTPKGTNNCLKNEGCWQPTSLTRVPSPRYHHTAIWTGKQMVVWGGADDLGNELLIPLNDGGIWVPKDTNDCTSNAGCWTPISKQDSLAPRYHHTAIWTGNMMIVWGGKTYNEESKTYSPLNTGFTWQPKGQECDSEEGCWRNISTDSAPSARYHHTAIWNGQEMIVWGGSNGSGPIGNGKRWSPMGANECTRPEGCWVGLATPSEEPSPRYQHSSVWHNGKLIVWGGRNNDHALITGGYWIPPTPEICESDLGCWFSLLGDPPAPRYAQTTLDTDEGMIVWGGNKSINENDPDLLNVGSLYRGGWDDAITGNKAPPARYNHTAVWNGNDMIIWGGKRVLDGKIIPTRSGSVWNKNCNCWAPTSLSNEPPARYNHTAVWTGKQMVVWGGSSMEQKVIKGGQTVDDDIANPIDWLGSEDTILAIDELTLPATGGKLGHEEHVPGKNNNDNVPATDLSCMIIPHTHYQGSDSSPLTYPNTGNCAAYSPHTKNQEQWYFNMRWPNSKYKHKKIILTNPKNGKRVVVSIEEYGPAGFVTERDGVNCGAPPEVRNYLGTENPYTGNPSDKKGYVLIGFASDQNIPLGPISDAKPGI